MNKTDNMQIVSFLEYEQNLDEEIKKLSYSKKNSNIDITVPFGGLLKQMSVFNGKDEQFERNSDNNNDDDILIRIDNYLTNQIEFFDLCDFIATRLSNEESKYFSNIQKGNLYIVHISDRVSKDDRIIITKIKYSKGLEIDTHDFKDFSDIEKLCLKIGVFYFSNNNLSNILVRDSLSTTSQYWWRTFLKISPILKSETATMNFFRTYQDCLKSKFGDEMTKIKLTYRDLGLNYLKSNNRFNFDDFIDFLSNNAHRELAIDEVSKHIEIIRAYLIKRINDQIFFREFDISTTKLKKMQFASVKLNKNIEININDEGKEDISIVGTGNDSYMKIKNLQENAFNIFKHEDE